MYVCMCFFICIFFFFNNTATTEIYTSSHTLSLHDALPILHLRHAGARDHAILLEISGHILRPDETAEQKCCRAARNARRHAAPARCSRRALRTCWSAGGPGPFPRVRQEQRRKAPERGGTRVDG